MIKRCRLPVLFRATIGLFAALACLMTVTAQARDIGVAFIEDGSGEMIPRLSSIIIKELQPLLKSGDILVPTFMSIESQQPIEDLMSRAAADPNVDFIVATGFFGSQVVYAQEKFPKPTIVLRLIDPDLSGAPVRDKQKNLRSYSSTNSIVDVFKRLSSLFSAKQVGIVVPMSGGNRTKSLSSAVLKAAKQFDIDARFMSLDFDKKLEAQFGGLDVVILPPVNRSEQERDLLLQALRRKKIPSYAVGGDDIVRAGALMSDTLNNDDRVLARRVALDIQLAVSGESRITGLRSLEARKRTTINIDTAEAIGIDFSLDELISARIVQGSHNALSLGYLSSIGLAQERNLSLKGQFSQLRVDQEKVEQARAARRPQLSAQLSLTRRGEALPQQDTQVAVSLSQKLYSPSSNANVELANIGLDASESTLRQTQIDTVQQTSEVFFQALQTQAQFESSLRDLALNRENLILAEKRKRNGSGSGADIYRWQAIIANSESALLRAYTANTSAQGRLAQLLNTRLHIPSTLADVDLDQPPFDLLHEALEPFLNSSGQAQLLHEASAARAIARSPQLDSAKANIAISDTNLETLKRGYYTPELSLTAQYGYYLDSSENAGGVELDNEGDWSLTVKAELPLWRGGSRKSLKQQYLAQGALADTQLQSTRIALWVNSGDAVNNLVANYRAIGLSERAESAALKSQQITQRAYKLGSSSVTELLDTQNSYREAQDNADIARYDYLTALVNFQALMGEMPMLQSGAEQQQWLHDFKQSVRSEASQ